jgi:SAM-dependent methyltransferase
MYLALAFSTGNNPGMEVRDWDKRYRLGEHAASDFEAGPTPLVMEVTRSLKPGKTLDLACGTGRNALWLAEQGWALTAVDGAGTAIDVLKSRALERGLTIEAVVADLEKGEFQIEPARWDLILKCYYLQKNLFEPAKRGVVPGGILIAIVHINAQGEEDGPYRLRPGELQQYFTDWEVLHLREGKACDLFHRRPVAEIVARKPPAS